MSLPSFLSHLRINPFLQLHLLVFIFAATTLIGRASDLSAPVLITWRCLFAAGGAFLWVALMRDRRIWLGRVVVGRLLSVGVIMGLHWLCLFGAVNIANVSIALAGLATLSVFTAFTEPLINRVKVRRFEVVLGMLVLFGICLIAGAEVGHLAGLALALLSALFAAVFMVVNKRIVESGSDPMVMVGWEMLAAAVVCLCAVPFIDPGGYAALAVGELVEWFWILLLAWGCTVFAQALANKLLKTISAYAFNLAANFEPVYGMIAAALIFAEYENLGMTFYLGAAAIVVANLLHPGLERRFGIRPSPGGLV